MAAAQSVDEFYCEAIVNYAKQTADYVRSSEAVPELRLLIPATCSSATGRGAKSALSPLKLLGALGSSLACLSVFIELLNCAGGDCRLLGSARPGCCAKSCLLPGRGSLRQGCICGMRGRFGRISPATIVIFLPTAAGVLAIDIAVLAGIHIVIFALRDEAAVPIGPVVADAPRAFRGSKASRGSLRSTSVCGLRPLVAAHCDGTAPIPICVRTLASCAIHASVGVVSSGSSHTAVGAVR